MLSIFSCFIKRSDNSATKVIDDNFLTSYGVLSLTVQTVERRSMAGILVILRKTQNYESIKLSAINAIIASLSVVLSALSDICIIKLSFIFKNCYRTSQNWLNTNLIKTVIKEKLKESIYSRPAQLCLFVVFRPTQEFLTHRETSPLPVKGCKFWPHGHWAVRVL